MAECGCMAELCCMTLQYWKVALPFEYPFTISGNRTKTHQPALMICLSDGMLEGWGEAPAIQYYQVNLDTLILALENKRSEIEALEFSRPEAMHARWKKMFPEHSFLVCALDMACWDLYGKRENNMVSALINAEQTSTVPSTDYTLGIDTPERMLAKMKAQPWPVYKVKVGFDGDVELLNLLMRESDARFRLDANAGWTFDEAAEKLQQLDPTRIEFVEQPISQHRHDEQGKLRAMSPIPLLADESCVSEEDVAACEGKFHGINIKLTKCGGITPAIRMIKEARRRNLSVMMGSMNESSVGTAAIAAFLGLLDFVDMDGPLLLRGDYASGLLLLPDQTILAGSSGLGITVNRQSLMSFHI